MSFQPPGPPPGPPFGGPVATPPWQSGPSIPIGLTQGDAPKGKSKLPIIVGAVVAVVVLVVVAVIALGGDDESGGSSFDAKAAHDGLENALGDATFDEDGYDGLRVCPLGDVDDLYDAVNAAIELDPIVGEGSDLKSAQEEDELPGFVSCQRDSEDPDKIDDGPNGIYFQAVFEPPRDYEGYLEDFAGDSSTVQFDDPEEYEGVKVYLLCWESVDDDGFDGCEADWVDTENKIAFAFYLNGTDTKSADAFTGLKAVLSTMAKSLAELAGPAS